MPGWFPTHLFRRVTSGGAVLAELDGLRAVAILPVVLFHATLSLYLKGAEGQVSAVTGDADVFRSPLGWTVAHGFLGVQLFFVISGFVVVLTFARARLLGERPPSLARYYLTRSPRSSAARSRSPRRTPTGRTTSRASSTCARRSSATSRGRSSSHGASRSRCSSTCSRL